jgi:DNA-binding NtrC family response regulator
MGRDPSCSWPLENPTVSARHARLERRREQFILRDLGSRNGTRVNGHLIVEAPLESGDVIELGQLQLTFLLGEGPQLNLVSKNPSWSAQLELIPRFARTEFPVLLIGPSGSGKDVIARTLHRLSDRADGPFVSINCSALSESLVESELFGHTKGSFTGATNDRKGAFETARGGTLFLDEIGDLPSSLQPKLLRAIENREIQSVGSDRKVQTNVRIIAATHQDLIQRVLDGRFREDLYYRLNVCRLQPPRLSDRMEDFEDLLMQFAKQHRVRFSFAAIQSLKAHSWSGNIRELRNLVARVSAHHPGQHIQPDHLATLIDAPLVRSQAVTHAEAPVVSGNVIREIERDLIVRRLKANLGNQRQTAKDLGLPKSTLHDRIKTYHIDLQQLRAPTP